MGRRVARTLIVAALAGLAGLAWLTGHPDAALLERAEGWPGVGAWARRFRDLYRPAPPTASPASAEPGQAVEIVTIWLPERTRPPIAPSPVAAGRPTDRAPAAGAEPPLGRAVEAPRPLPARPADPERLRAAQAALGGAPQRTMLGPYALIADAGLEPPLARWSALAAALDAAFTERTGCAPLGEPAETVVLFADEGSYRTLQRSEARLAGIATGGHAIAGLAALWSTGRRAGEVEATLVHELTHFVARRALGPALPPWLDEGLAEDLGQAPFDAERARFAPGGWRVDVQRTGPRIEIRGALAALDLATRELDRTGAPPVATLLHLDWEGFVGAEAPLRYAQALAWIRFLLDGPDPGRAARFREFLDGVARGESADGDRLLGLLGVAPAELEAEFAAWLREQRRLRFVAAGVPPAPPAQAPEGASGSSSRQAAPPSP